MAGELLLRRSGDGEGNGTTPAAFRYLKGGDCRTDRVEVRVFGGGLCMCWCVGMGCCFPSRFHACLHIQAVAPRRNHFMQPPNVTGGDGPGGVWADDGLPGGDRGGPRGEWIKIYHLVDVGVWCVRYGSSIQGGGWGEGDFYALTYTYKLTNLNDHTHNSTAAFCCGRWPASCTWARLSSPRPPRRQVSESIHCVYSFRRVCM